MQLKDIMIPEVERLHKDASIKKVAQKMKAIDVGMIPVYDGNRLVGMVTDRDIASGRACVPLAAAVSSARGGSNYGAPVSAQSPSGGDHHSRQVWKRYRRRVDRAGLSRDRRQSVLPAGVPACLGASWNFERAPCARRYSQSWWRRRRSAANAGTPAGSQSRSAAPGASAGNPGR